MTGWAKRRRSVLAGLAAGAMGLLGTIAAPSAFAQPEGDLVGQRGDTVSGEYVVKFKDSAVAQSRSSVQAHARDLTAEHGGQADHYYHAVLRGFSVKTSEQSARRMAAEPSVEFVSPVHRLRMADEQPNPTWGLNRIDQRNLPLDSKYSYPAKAGEGVTVYVLDTGARFNHPDYEGRVTSGRDTVDDDNDSADCQGHGTHVTGTVLSKTWGVAKKAKGVAVRVLNCQGSGSESDILAGMDWIRSNATKPAVVNFSIGCPQPCDVPSFDRAVRNLVSSGIQFVQAAGNSSQDACNFSPQKVAEAITVGNSEQDDDRASSSNYGRCLDLFAPGTSITSTTMNGQSGQMTGTSMASPHVAGAAALYLSCNPSATPQQVRDGLVDNGTTGKINNPGSGSPNVLLYTAFLVTGCGGGGDDNFAISTDPSSGSVQAGQEIDTTVLTETTAGNPQSVRLSASGLPSGASATFDPTTIESGAKANLTIKTAASTPAGDYTVTVNGDGASVDRTTSYKLTVQGDGGGDDDFSMAADPSSVKVEPGQAAQTRITTKVTAGNPQSVSLSATGLPSGAAATFDPETVQSGGTAELTAKIPASTQEGTYNVTIHGDGASVDRTAAFEIVVGDGGGGTDDYELVADPNSVTVGAGESAKTTVNSKVTAGQAQQVSLSASGLPSGASATFDPSTINSGDSSTLTVRTGTSTPAGRYTVTVRGDGAVADRNTTFTLTVQSAGGQPPVAQFTVQCTGPTCGFDASQSTGTISSYAWAFGDGATASGVRTTHAYGLGSFTARLTVTGNNGQSASASRRIDCYGWAPSYVYCFPGN